jgi:hypothetical protein
MGGQKPRAARARPSITPIRTGLGLVAIAHRTCAAKAAVTPVEDAIEPDAVRAGDVCWLCGKLLLGRQAVRVS